ncbi:MAG: DUF1080 domain-containing protein [Opitutaceae bacterium]|nr:DUF1080 domain-containing protein [Opitutaceae bacterium]
MKLALTLFSICLFLLYEARTETDSWISLFNGRDLSNWHTNRAEGSFSVKDGLLVAKSTDLRSHLFFIGDGKHPIAFKNFELIVIAQGAPESNSGIFVHTDYALRDEKGHLANGYEINLNTSKSVTRKTGSLYDVVDLRNQPLDDTQWFETRIRVNGNRIQVWLDREQVVDYREPANPKRKESRKGRLLNPNGGAIAIQAHDPDSTWYFKEIRIKHLKD